MPTQDDLLSLASATAAACPRLRLAHQEADSTDAHEGEAAHFLKLDGSRLGRDIELYRFMAGIRGWEGTLISFLEEVVMPLKLVAPDAYREAGQRLQVLGETVYPADLLADWRALFA